MSLTAVTVPGRPVDSLPAQIHGSLEESIIAGELEPGSRLRADEIAGRHGVSRIPVREALSSLHEAGWVDIRPRYGVYVRERTRAELAELFEARAGLESEIARLAAIRATPDDLASLRDITERSRLAVETHDVDALNGAAVDYNAALRRGCRNSVLSVLSLTLEKRARFYFSPIAQRLGPEWVVGQERLVGLLSAATSAAAADSARRHIVETGEAVALLLPASSFSS